jgi:hypothetical protein
VEPHRLLCHVSAKITRNGEPVRGVAVHLVAESDERDVGVLGRTDATGRSAGWIGASGASRIVLSGVGGFELETRASPVVLEHGASIECTAEIVAGDLEILWPEAAAGHGTDGLARRDALFGVGLSRDGSPEEVRWLGKQATTPRVRAGTQCAVLRLGPLEPGDYTVRLMEFGEIDVSPFDTEWTWPPRFQPRRVGSASVHDGTTSTCVLSN